MPGNETETRQVLVGLRGDPTPQGERAMDAARIPDPFRSAPGQDRFVTVIKGTWWTGEGNVFDPGKTVAVKAGGFMLHPKGLHHYDGAKDEEVIVQIIGMGPVTTTDVEARNTSR